MATYYVNPATGSDSAAGEVGTPLKTLAYALAYASASDTVNVVAPKSAPVRELVVLSKNTTLQGSGGVPAYICGTTDVTPGAARPDPLKTGSGSFEAWVNNNTPYGWGLTVSQASDITKSAAEHLNGIYSCAFVRSTGYVQATQSVYLPANTLVTVTYGHKEAVASNFQMTKIYISDPNGAQNYVYFTGASVNAARNGWQNSGAAVDVVYMGITYNTSTMTESSFNFLTNQSGRIDIILSEENAAPGSPNYFDDFRISFATNSTFEWTLYSTDVYTCDFGVEPNDVMICLLSDYLADGIDALRYIPLAAGIAACQAATPSQFYDSGTGLTYVNFGGDVNDYHVEAGLGGAGTGYALKYTGTAGTVNDMELRSAHIPLDVQNTGTFNRVGAKVGYIGVHNSIAGAPVFNDCTAQWAEKDGFLSTNVISTYRRCLSSHNHDDGFQSTSASGGLIAHSCISHSNGVIAGGSNIGFSNESGSSLACYNCVAYSNRDAGFGCDSAGTTVTLMNCVAFDNVQGGSGGISDITISGAGTIVVKNNCATTWTDGYSGSNGNITADPLFISATPNAQIADASAADNSDATQDFRLSPGSPCYRTGTAIAFGRRDYRGRRESIPPNMGAYTTGAGDPATNRVARSV